MSSSRVVVVVPTYNEAENVTPLVAAVKRIRGDDLVLFFIDDSSPDGTAREVEEASRSEPWVSLMVRSTKKGIGSAYQEGFKECIARFSPQVVVEMDADLQHPPQVIGALVAAVDGGADVAVASRYVGSGSVSGWSFSRRLVSRAANAYARALLRIKVRDATSGFRAYSRATAEKVSEARLPAKGFEFQVAALHLLRKTSRAVEVPFSFSVRSAGSSKLGVSAVLRFFFSVLWMALT